MATISRFPARFVGALRLDPATYDEVLYDPRALAQALFIVIAPVLVWYWAAGSLGGWLAAALSGPLLGATAKAVLSWQLESVVAFVVGNRFLVAADAAVPVPALLRVVGFANAPLIFAAVAELPGLAPGIGGLLMVVTTTWAWAATVVAVRRAFTTTTVQAFVLSVLMLLPELVFYGVVAPRMWTFLGGA